MESAPIYITPRTKTPTWRCGALRPPVVDVFETTPRSYGPSFASFITCFGRLDAQGGPEAGLLQRGRAGVYAVDLAALAALYEKWGWDATLYDGAE